MSTDYTDTQLEMLSRRWAQDASPHLSLQLADVYRQRGQLQEALPVLEKGLEAHPGHMSVQVALGRYRLEAGDPEGAAAVLRQVVDKDPGHLVANKLLVRAYLAMRDRKSAADRLELYALLNENDPELETLRAMVGGELAAEPAPRQRPTLPPTFAVSAAGPRAELAAVARPARRSLRGGRGVPFRELIASPLIARALPEVFRLAGAAPSEPPRTEAAPARRVVPGAEEPAAKPEVTKSEVEVAEVQSQEAETREVARAPEAAETPEEPFADQPDRGPAAGESRPAPQRVDPDAGATATLGALYLAQGHLEDARRTFTRVLERDPDDSEARAGLAAVESRLRGGAAEASSSDDRGSARARRATIEHLEEYLSRIRTAAARSST